MDSHNLGYALKIRANIYNTRSIVNEHVEKPPRDWDGLEVLISEETKDNQELKEALSSYLKSELENNYKILSLYHLSTKSADSFRKLSASVTKKITYPYPAILSGAKLAGLSQLHFVVSSESTQEYTRIVLSRRRTFTLRKKIDKADLSGLPAHTLDIYDDVYGVSNYHWQTFDVITLNNKTNILEIRADYTRAENSYQNGKQIELSLGETLGWIVFNCSSLGLNFSPDAAMNLFPAIQYFTFNAEGYISKLNFMTPQGSIKQDTMKRGEDLRSEQFYANGLQAVAGAITPFDISVIWHIPNRFSTGQEVELTLPSTISVATAGSRAALTYAILRFCSTEEETRLLIDKLLEALRA
ncbi:MULTISPECIES: hypothetical protein [Pseudomonas]|uniref:Uncharacterized protein n=5 Tax=Pseudomonas TaxID=286 RepID=A0AB37ZI38_PSESX|nr:MULTISPECIES: hypothetical protein [Pseudomonas]AVB13412.1 hypothetical protein BKM19_007195 [Pseudomonas amygdali pv. morsprunorum]KWS51273.1 hypothetical protein AL056_12030 [Pseudomonas amygdali pv. morsprunorum]KWS69716.1 hypothetical protein AL054_18425 [Pseudomonas amygdali pv. morsprunorum]MBD1107296.1 hypothetical protein [Pseudomonas amygdali pv. morsprunorum]MBI6668368.1 hypothetical protein [Pseudomonas syringae]